MPSSGDALPRVAVVGLSRRDVATGEVGVFDSHLHGDDDSICPRCLTWIDGRDFVRRNGFGLLQHEVCPPG